MELRFTDPETCGGELEEPFGVLLQQYQPRLEERQLILATLSLRELADINLSPSLLLQSGSDYLVGLSNEDANRFDFGRKRHRTLTEFTIAINSSSEEAQAFAHQTTGLFRNALREE